MAKLILSDVVNIATSANLINNNSASIETAFENTLSRDGTGPNHMESDLDMNGFNILNQSNVVSIEGFNWRGSWVTATLYKIGDAIEHDNSSYITIVEHTSGIFANDFAAFKWQLLAASADIPNQATHNGDILTTNGSLASWADVNTLALPISGGTLTGALVGTSATFTGALIGTTANLSGSLTGTTANLTGLITPNEVVGIKGTTTSNSAQAGSIGEVIESTIVVGSATALTNGVSKTITSITLTPGDWQVSGAVRILGTATTNLTQLQGCSSLTTNVAEDASSFQYHTVPLVVGGAFNLGFAIPNRRISISATTVIYLVANCVFSASTASGWGNISARRMR